MNGCCYGREAQEDKDTYLKKCGQSFWEFVSGDPDFYTRIIEPVGHRAKQRNDEFEAERSNVINRFATEFSAAFCEPNGAIDWPKLVRFNSGRDGTQ